MSLPDPLERFRKEFMVPMLVSVLSFHPCPVTAADGKRGVAAPGRSLPFCSLKLVCWLLSQKEIKLCLLAAGCGGTKETEKSCG